MTTFETTRQNVSHMTKRLPRQGGPIADREGTLAQNQTLLILRIRPSSSYSSFPSSSPAHPPPPSTSFLGQANNLWGPPANVPNKGDVFFYPESGTARVLGLEESGGGEGQGAADQQVSNRGQRRGGEASERQRNQAPIEPSGNRARLEPSKRDASRQAHPSVLGFSDRQSSRDSGGIAISWPRIPPASCSNHGRDVARPLCRRDHRLSAR